MKIVFLSPGKYKSEIKVVKVSSKDVNDETVFDICTDNALNFIRAGKAFEDGKPKPAKEPNPDDFKESDPVDPETDLDKLKLDELLDFAKLKEIDLGENKLKADVLEAIKKALEAAE